MADGTNQQLDQQFSAFQLGTPGARIRADDFLKTSGVEGLMRFLMLAAYDEGAEAPIGGIIGEFGGLGNSLAVSKGAGDLDWQVEPGAALVYVPAEIATSSPFVATAYRPAVLTTQATGTLSAHDPTLSRRDLVVLTPSTVDDTGESRAVKSLVNGSISAPNPTVNTRRGVSGSISIVEGTPGGGTPSVPAGTMLLAEITVPAGSGPITLQNFSDYAQWTAMRSLPPRSFFDPHILSNSPTPIVSAGVSAILITGVHAALVGGIRAVRDAIFTPSNPSVSNTRIDRIDIGHDGAYFLTEGVQTTGTPAIPAQPASSSVPVLHYTIASTGAKSDVTFIFNTAPIGPDQLQADAVTTAKIADGAVGASQISDGAVTNSKLATSAVTNEKVAANTLTTSKVASTVVTAHAIGTASMPVNNPVLAVTGDAGVWLMGLSSGTFFFEYAFTTPLPATWTALEAYFQSVDDNVNQARLQLNRRSRGASGVNDNQYDSGVVDIPDSGLTIAADLDGVESIDEDYWWQARITVIMNSGTALGTGFRGLYWQLTHSQFLSA